MRTLQSSVSGVLPSRLDGGETGSSFDAFQRRGLRRYIPRQKLIFMQNQRALIRDGYGGSGDGSAPDPAPSTSGSKVDDSINFCIIEGRDTVLDFAQMQLQEIRDNINSRRNKIFLLMEEVRRLRIQQRIKAEESEQGGISIDPSLEDPSEELTYASSIPFLPPLTSATLQQYYATCLALVSSIILFGGLLAPVLELKLGLGGTSYAEFIRTLHLPNQLSQVDPIVASFSGGAVGVISALMVVEVNNVRQQEHKRCRYCQGTGYLACARCSGAGKSFTPDCLQSEAAALAESLRPSAATVTRCSNCAGAGKVMCPTCLCTGVTLATEHDPRIDPFL